MALTTEAKTMGKVAVQVISAGVKIDGEIYGLAHKNEPVNVSERDAKTLIRHGKAKPFDRESFVPSRPPRLRTSTRGVSLADMVSAGVGTAVQAVLEAQKEKDALRKTAAK